MNISLFLGIIMILIKMKLIVSYNYKLPVVYPNNINESNINDSINRLHRIAFGSCYKPTINTTKFNIFTSILQSKPSKLILLGDMIYADRVIKANFHFGWSIGSIATIKSSYELLSKNQLWQNLLIYMNVTTGNIYNNIYATIDDHDFGANNADKTLPFRNSSQQLFWDFYKIPIDSNIRHQSGVYNSHIIHISHDFVYKVILLDTRSNKDVSNWSKQGDFLGHEQWQWLMNELSSPILLHGQYQMPNLILIGSSIQVLPNDKLIEENWFEFPTMRRKLLSMLHHMMSLTNIILLSGDVHSAEFLQASCQINGKTRRLIEFTSSGLSHSFTQYIPDNDQVFPQRRSILTSFFDIIYQSFGSHSYREQRVEDYYHGINFGLIDILYNSTSFDFSLHLIIQNYFGQMISSRLIRLKSYPIYSNYSQTLEILQSIYDTSNDDDFSCQGIHGDVSMIRIILFYSLLVLICCMLFIVIIFLIRLMIAITKTITRKQKLK